jgi:hypothetical protein
MAKKITDLTNYDDTDLMNNPDARLKDRVYDTDGTTVLEEGSRIFSPFIQDLLNPFHRFGRFLGRYLSGVADTQKASQYFSWLAANIMHRGSNFYDATYASNTYTLTRTSYEDSPMTYKSGLVAEFLAPAANGSTTVNINLAGVGSRPVADYLLGPGDPVTVDTGSITQGEFIRVVYQVRASDSFGYFRIIRVSLSQLAYGTLALLETGGGTTQSLDLSLTEIALGYSATGTDRSARISNGGMLLSNFTTSAVYQIFLDMVNGILYGKETSLMFSGVVEGKLRGKGIQFENGPNNSTTSPVIWRPTVIEIPLGATQFYVSSSSPANWRMMTPGGTPYIVDTHIPDDCKILGAYAHYSTANGDVQGAPVGYTDYSGSPGSFFNNWSDITILSGDAALPSRKPQVTSGDEFMTLTIWYDGASIL